MQAFLSSFSAAAEAMLQILIVTVIAGLMVRKGIFRETDIKALSAVTVNLLLPCLIFAAIVQGFDPGAFRFWWLLPLSGVAMPMAGIGLAALFFWRELPAKRNLLPLAGLHNAGYLVLPVGQAMFPGEFDRFALYCFLFILGISPLLWSLGKHLVTAGSPGEGGRGFMTPPFWANVLALVFVFTGARQLLPHPVIGAIDFLGSATVPVALVVLGATLGTVSLKIRPPAWDMVRVLSVKFLIIPGLTAVVLACTGLRYANPLLADFFMIHASAAPATALIIQVRKYGGDRERIGSLVLVSYLICLVALPLWLAVSRAM